MPARITIIIEGLPPAAVFVTVNTRTTDRTPNRKAESCTWVAPKPTRIPSAAPKEAPLATPRVSGVASGLAKRLWNAAPADESPAPARSARRIRGIRILKRTVCTLVLPSPRPQISAQTTPGAM